uniref:Uncharacterized protein n=1 Tax=Arundo donax TaxID=35708 RepID=A0A0A9GBD9_ARUDO
MARRRRSPRPRHPSLATRADRSRLAPLSSPKPATTPLFAGVEPPRRRQRPAAPASWARHREPTWGYSACLWAATAFVAGLRPTARLHPQPPQALTARLEAAEPPTARHAATTRPPCIRRPHAATRRAVNTSIHVREGWHPGPAPLLAWPPPSRRSPCPLLLSRRSAVADHRGLRSATGHRPLRTAIATPEGGRDPP